MRTWPMQVTLGDEGSPASVGGLRGRREASASGDEHWAGSGPVAGVLFAAEGLARPGPGASRPGLGLNETKADGFMEEELERGRERERELMRTSGGSELKRGEEFSIADARDLFEKMTHCRERLRAGKKDSEEKQTHKWIISVFGS
ncbi:uncharacterized protein A4U43_C07F5150 [Asparagus officinalis]|uniref:Uncharacterized protein n=1 Tax=Asparagus officinalis TaxID=4686 RepID=A0A5P1ECU7_ASPOF|nr:uncharacterized protein A4U43_C07F5150 [Asparagus officinalis]